jgi:hypothetical protein
MYASCCICALACAGSRPGSLQAWPPRQRQWPGGRSASWCPAGELASAGGCWLPACLCMNFTFFVETIGFLSCGDQAAHELSQPCGASLCCGCCCICVLASGTEERLQRLIDPIKSKENTAWSIWQAGSGFYFLINSYLRPFAACLLTSLPLSGTHNSFHFLGIQRSRAHPALRCSGALPIGHFLSAAAVSPHCHCPL